MKALPDVNERVSRLDLIKLEDPNQISHGDTVYEAVRFGTGEDHVKYNAFRVERVERQAVLCNTLSQSHRRGEPITLPFSRLLIKRPELPPAPERLQRPFVGLRRLVPTPKQEPQPAPIDVPAVIVASPPEVNHDDAVQQWLDTGRNLLGGIEAEVKDAVRERDACDHELSRVDNLHHRRIEELEAQLESARRDHFQARTTVLERREKAVQRFMLSGKRRAGILKMLEAATGR